MGYRLGIGKDSGERLAFGHVVERSTGRYLERRVVSSVCKSCPIVRIADKVEYVDVETGEVTETPSETGESEELRSVRYVRKDDGLTYVGRVRSVSRMSNIRSVRTRCNEFKWLVRANERQARLFITLTYKENMTDTKRLYEDFRKFWQKMTRRFPWISGYLVAFEPQERGAWHAHIILLSNRKVFISNKVIHRLWKHGFTKTKSCASVRMLGEYLTSYLVNVKDGEETKKGARLALYPANFQFLRHSKGILRHSQRTFDGYACIVPDLKTWELAYDYQHDLQRGKNGIKCRIFLFSRLSSPLGFPLSQGM